MLEIHFYVWSSFTLEFNWFDFIIFIPNLVRDKFMKLVPSLPNLFPFFLSFCFQYGEFHFPCNFLFYQNEKYEETMLQSI